MSANIFNSKNLLSKNRDIYSESYLTSNNNIITENMYLSESLSFLIEVKKEYNEALKMYYKSIYESTSQYAINESFNDFFNKVREIVNEIIKFVKKIYNKFILNIALTNKPDKYIEKNKDKLNNFNSNHEFKMDMYKYTFNPSIPVINAIKEFDKDFIILDIENNKHILSTHLKKIIKDTKEEMLGNMYDRIRAEILCIDNQLVYQEDYQNELFKIFRDGKDSKSEELVNLSIVLESLYFFEKYDIYKSQIEKDKQNIEKQYKDIEKKISNFITTIDRNGYNKFNLSFNNDILSTDIEIDSDVRNSLDTFLKLKIQQITEISSLHLIAFSSKLDAIIECSKQNKDILYKAFSKVIEKGVEEDI